MMYYYNGFLPSHMFGFGSIFMMLFWVCIAYGLFSLFWHYKFAHKAKLSSSSALEIVKERYARGEITKEEFISIKQDIN